MSLLPPLVEAADIDAEDDIWRRIPGIRSHLTYDHDNRRWRPSSAAFEDHGDDDAMSALLAREDTPDRATAGRWAGAFLAVLKAAVYRGDKQLIVRDPTPEEPSHLGVIGPKPKSVRRRWAEKASWVSEPNLTPPA